jgi:hypothetical protein
VVGYDEDDDDDDDEDDDEEDDDDREEELLRKRSRRTTVTQTGKSASPPSASAAARKPSANVRSGSIGSVGKSAADAALFKDIEASAASVPADIDPSEPLIIDGIELDRAVCQYVLSTSSPIQSQTRQNTKLSFSACS